MSTGTPASGKTHHWLELEGSAPMRVIGYRGEEELGRTYALDIYFLAELELEVAALIEVRAALRTERDALDPLVFHGVIAEAGFIAPGSPALYTARLVPELERLRYQRHTRVFPKAGATQVIAATLEKSGFSKEDYSLPSVPPRVRPQICQFEEHDLDFITRWMEHDGLHYLFDQRGTSEKLVVVDGHCTDPALDVGIVPYQQHSGPRWGVSKVRSAARLGPQRARVSAYSPDRPDTRYTRPEASQPASESSVVTGLTLASLTHPDPEHAVTADAVAEREHQCLEEIYRVDRESVTGECDGPVLHAGARFRLDGHPRPDLDREYYVTRVIHQACDVDAPAEFRGAAELEVGQTAYVARFSAIRAGMPFRLARRTATPRIFGVRSAVIDGPDTSDYAQLDEYGQYLVRLRHDEEETADGSASMRVRMMQPSAGNPQGFHFPLRKGTEVMLVFLDGDPDRPLIAGAVTDATHPSPVTQANHTLNVIQTGALNRLELEDDTGREHVLLKTPALNSERYQGADRNEGGKTYNLVDKTDGTALHKVGGDQDIKVGGSLTESVSGNLTQLVVGSVTRTVLGDERQEISGERHLHVHDNYHLTVSDEYKVKVRGDYDVQHDKDTVEFTAGKSSDTFVGAKNENFIGVVNSNSFAAVNENFLGIVNSNAFSGVIETFWGPVLSNRLADVQEMTIGNIMDVGLGGRLSVDVGQRVNIGLGGTLTCEGGATTLLHVGVKVSIALAAEINLTLLGLSASALEISATGFKIDRTFAVNENEPVGLKDGITTIHNKVTSIFK